LKIVTLNLRHGGADRVRRIADYLLENEAEIIVLTEFRENSSGALLTDRLTATGLQRFVAPAQDARKNRVALFAPSSARALPVSPEDEDAHRIVACEVNGVAIAGVYFAQLAQKATLFDYLNKRLPPLHEDVLVIGDFNTGLHYLDEPGATFACADQFQKMGERGYSDLWRRAHGEGAREYSWMSSQRNGFRIDHAMGTGTIPSRTVACYYDHDTRRDFTDHSALWVTLR